MKDSTCDYIRSSNMASAVMDESSILWIPDAEQNPSEARFVERGEGR